MDTPAPISKPVAKAGIVMGVRNDPTMHNNPVMAKILRQRRELCSLFLCFFAENECGVGMAVTVADAVGALPSVANEGVDKILNNTIKKY
ncbi:MAG: hypothetical protein RL757_2293 [Bacteroidota bacterium]